MNFALYEFIFGIDGLSFEQKGTSNKINIVRIMGSKLEGSFLYSSVRRKEK